MRAITLLQVIVGTLVLACAAPGAPAQTRDRGAGPARDMPTDVQHGDQPKSSEQPKVQGRARIEDSRAPAAGPRFKLQRVDGGYLRLDGDTGDVAFCAPRDPNWTCRNVSDGRTAQDKSVLCVPGRDPDWRCQAVGEGSAAPGQEAFASQEQVKSLHDEIAPLQGEMTSLNAEISSLRADLALLATQVTPLQSEAAALKNEIAPLHEETASLKAALDPLGEKVTSLKVEIAPLHDAIASAKKEIAPLQSEVASLKTAIAPLRDEAGSLKADVARLHDEVSSLRKEIAVLISRLPPPPPPSPPADADGDLAIKLPSRDDIARAGAYLQDSAKDAWHRLVDMISNFQRDVMRKS